MNSSNSYIVSQDCYIHVKAHDENSFPYERDTIRKNICNGLQLIEYKDGNRYCIFHLPTKEKNHDEFTSLCFAKIESLDRNLIQIENNFHESQKAKAKSRLILDFRFVWFPKDIYFLDKIFKIKVDFSNAYFSSDVAFNKSIFHADTRFIETQFKESASFSGSKFLFSTNFLLASFYYGEFISTTFSENLETNFSLSTFEHSAAFDWTTFGDVDFSSSIFGSGSSFKSAIFHKTAKFNEAHFVESNRTFLLGDKTISIKKKHTFSKATFEKDVFFDKAEFEEKVSFNSSIFGKDSDILFRRTKFSKYVDFRYATCDGYLRFEKLQLDESSCLDFHEAAFERSSRISFHTLKLSPFWFINVDSRKFHFLHIDWIDLDELRKSRSLEYLALNIRDRVEYPIPLLKIACRQLAENGENNNRFEEASKFRQIAFECERLERKERISKWWCEETKNCFRDFLKSLPIQLKTFPYDLVHWLYRWTSGYGENRLWAGGILLFIVMVFFPLIYTQTNFYVCPIEKNDTNCKTRTLTIGEGIRQSLSTATLQNVDTRKPNSSASEIFTILEKIIAPLQLALLALAIRRKFMR